MHHYLFVNINVYGHVFRTGENP